MSAPILGRIREIAKTEKRSLSQQLEMLVEQYFDNKPRRSAKAPARKIRTREAA